MTCPACGQDELQGRKSALFDKTRRRPLTLHRECPNGHAWHVPLLTKAGSRPMPCDCEPHP